MHNNIHSIWGKVTHTLQQQLGKEIFMSWIFPLQPIEIENKKLILLAPSIFMKNWIMTHYSEQINLYIHKENSEIDEIALKVEDNKSLTTIPVNGLKNFNNLGLYDKYNFSNFIVNRTNNVVYNSLKSISQEHSCKPEFNPFFLYGSSGMGKTHLLKSFVSAYTKNNPDKNCLYLSTEKFIYDFIHAMRSKNTQDFKTQLRSLDCLVLDDFHFISEKSLTQEEFLHTFNSLFDKEAQIIISADRPPLQIPGLKDSLQSRLNSGFVINIQPMDYDLCLQIFQKKINDAQIYIEDSVLMFLAMNLKSNIRGLEGIINQIIIYKKIYEVDITKDFIKDKFFNLIHSKKIITVENIQKIICQFFHINKTELLSLNRKKDTVYIRQLSMYLSKKLTNKSYNEIAKKFSRKDHTTVIHAVKKIESALSKSITLQTDIEKIKEQIL